MSLPTVWTLPESHWRQCGRYQRVVADSVDATRVSLPTMWTLPECRCRQCGRYQSVVADSVDATRVSLPTVWTLPVFGNSVEEQQEDWDSGTQLVGQQDLHLLGTRSRRIVSLFEPTVDR